jgi:hypothetical protein
MGVLLVSIDEKDPFGLTETYGTPADWATPPREDTRRAAAS